MGDNSCRIKVEFSIFDEEYKLDWSINYCPEGIFGEGTAERIETWLEEKYADAKWKAEKEDRERIRKENEAKQEIIEREEYERLRKKFG